MQPVTVDRSATTPDHGEVPVTTRRASFDGSVLPLAILLLGVAAFVLGVVGLAERLPPQTWLDWADLVYRALQLFVLDGAALQGLTSLPTALQVARFLAPAATVLALLLAVRALLVERVRRGRIRRMRRHIVVCGDGDSALALARNLHAEGRRVVLVREAGPPTFPLLTVDGDPRRPATLVGAGAARAQRLYACAPSSTLNVAIALVAGTLGRSVRGRLETIAQVESEDLVEVLRVRRLAARAAQAAGVDLFSLDDVAARALLGTHRLTAGVPLVVGFDSLGQSVVRSILRHPVPEGERRELVVVTADAAGVAELASRLDAAGRRWSVRVGEEDDAADQVFVCLADEDRALAVGLRLARHRPVIACLRTGSPFREALDLFPEPSGAQRGLRVFGVLEEGCREDPIADGRIVIRTARAIHQGYVDDAASRGDTVTVNPSMCPWEELPSHLRDANRAQAEHIGDKLAELGAVLTTRPPDPPFVFTGPEIERLARLEHQRWVAERLAAGLVWGPRREEVRPPLFAWLPRRLHPGRRTHPDLVDWSDLAKESQDKDRQAVRRMPALLAAEGLYIERLGESDAPVSATDAGR